MQALEVGQDVSFKNILLVHVVPPVSRVTIPIEPSSSESNRECSEEELAMQVLISGDQLKEIPHEMLLRRGSIWPVLSELIERDEIDLLVVGTHGRGGLKRVILGSVAEELFRRASCPVLTIGPAVPAGTGRGSEFCRILFATDFGPASLNALPYAIALALESHGKLTLLHVLTSLAVFDVGPYWYTAPEVVDGQERARLNTIAKLENLIPRGTRLPSDSELLVGFGPVADEIVTIATASQADFIVLGLNRSDSTRVSAHLPWTTAPLGSRLMQSVRFSP